MKADAKSILKRRSKVAAAFGDFRIILEDSARRTAG